MNEREHSWIEVEMAVHDNWIIPERVHESLGHGRVSVAVYTESNLYARRGAGQRS